jgi:hypothetical protein
MNVISQRLNELRQEITDLRSMNIRYSQGTGHSALEKSAYELRTHRLLQIKEELSNMQNPVGGREVWWERARS